MLTVILSWINIFIITLGFGILGRKIVFGNKISEQKGGLFQTILVGIITTTIFLEIVSLFVGVNLIINVLFTVAAVGLIFLLPSGPIFQKQKIASFFIENGLLVLLIGTVTVVLSYIAAGKVLNYDEGLYYVSFIQWHQQFSIVPGLGNLYGRLAFNSNWHLFTSLFYFNQPHVYYLNETSSFFIFIWVCFVLDIALNKNNDSLELRIFGFLGVLFIFPALFPFQPFSYISELAIVSNTSCSPDIFVIAMVYYCFYLAKKDSNAYSMWLLVVVPVFLVTVKMSALPCLFFSVYGTWKLFKASKNSWMLKAVLMSLLVGGCWLLRNYLLSGYLVYPFAGIDLFNPDWKIPLENVKTEACWVMNFAKQIPLEDRIYDYSWVGHWWEVQPLFIKCLLLFSIISTVVGGISSLVTRDYKNSVVYFIGGIGILFWFLTAPDPRFAMGFIWAMASNFLSKRLAVLFSNRPHVQLKMAFSSFSVLLLFSFGAQAYQKETFSTRRLLLPQPLHYLETNLKVNPVNGILVYRPMYWDQCLDCPIPCSPYTVYGQKFKFDIEKRGETFQSGFRQRLSQ